MAQHYWRAGCIGMLSLWVLTVGGFLLAMHKAKSEHAWDYELSYVLTKEVLCRVDLEPVILQTISAMLQPMRRHHQCAQPNPMPGIFQVTISEPRIRDMMTDWPTKRAQ